MGKKNFYTATKTINGTEYVAQFNGLSCALRAVDQSYIEGSSNTSVEKMAEYIFKNVIVEPQGLTIDDFTSIEEFNEVVSFGREVMQGKFRNEETNKTAAK
jgi:hypothetical protein